MADERADVVVVGARCAGSAVAAVLAEAGRRVVVLERGRLPSDTLSTHLMFPSGCAEFQRIGAWPEINERLRPAPLRRVRITLDNGVECHERLRPVEGIDHGVCIPRIQLDELLAENARRLGAEVRERCAVEGVLWESGRACGVTYRDGDRLRRVRANLVIGADGRRSTVAAEVGAWRPYRASRNGRGLVFRYMDDPHAAGEWGETMWQWRDRDSLAFAFPNPGGRMLMLFMADAGEVAEARRAPESYWERKLALHPGARRRIEGAGGQTKLRSTGDVVAFFRASSGPGWALAGDAGHFKDPVIGQGMRDALWMGRTLGEAVQPALDGGPAALDRALRRWEAERDRECLPAYHFANSETRARPYSPVLAEALRRYGGEEARPEIGDVFQRLRSPQEVLTLRRLAVSLLGATRRGPQRLRVLRDGLTDAMIELRVARELREASFRPAAPVPGSDHPGWSWPEPPAAARVGEPEPRRGDRAVAS